MFDEAVREILDSLNEKPLSKYIYPKFSDDGYQSHEVDLKNFHQITKSISEKRIAYIDGGNAEIIGSGNFSLNLIRVCCVIFQNNRKLAIRKSEILAFVRAVNENGEIHYKTKIFGLNNDLKLEEITFNSLDETLTVGRSRAEINSIANAVRRFAELQMSKFAADGKMADIIVLDGNLQCTLANENKYFDELHESCRKNNVILSGLCKTTSLFTDDGDLLSAVLMRLNSTSSWFYHPIVEINSTNHKAEMLFAKFHDKSKHVFRFEIFKEQKEKAGNVINEIANNCYDPVFLGYPYGLVEADRAARVSNQEKESLKTMFLVKLRNRNIEKYLSAANAHEILDRISF